MELRKMLKMLVRVPSSAKKKGKSLTKLILDLCKKEGILGATVTNAIHGYGETDYPPHILRSVGDLPVIIEIIDDPHLIQNLLPKIKGIVGDRGLITIEEVYAL